MIKFTDVCKAYVRYWYVILVCIILAFALVFAVTSTGVTYTAKSTILVDKNKAEVSDNEFISQSYAASVIKEMDMRIKHSDFTKNIAKRAGNEDDAFVASIQRDLKVSYKKDATFFEIVYVSNDESVARSVVDAATKLALEEYNSQGNKAVLQHVYNIESSANPSKRGVYAVIGALIGLVLGIVIVTFFVVFNPYVENKELLEKETGLPVLASIGKLRGNKDEE